VNCLGRGCEKLSRRVTKPFVFSINSSNLVAGGLCALAVYTRSFHKSSAVKPKTDFALRSPATPALDTKARRAGIRPPSCPPSATGSKRPKLSGFAVQPQLCRCPTPISFAKASSSHHSSGDLGSKSHQNQRSTTIRFDVMRPRTPNRQSAPSPCGLAAATLAM
jgi:hypothetical protein